LGRELASLINLLMQRVPGLLLVMSTNLLRLSLIIELLFTSRPSRRNDRLSESAVEKPVELVSTQPSPSQDSTEEVSNEEREREILEIERGILELTEIFHDLSSVVTSQGAAVGKINDILRWPSTD
jgi:hypothetical protein